MRHGLFRSSLSCAMVLAACLLLALLCAAPAWAAPKLVLEGVSGELKSNVDAYIGKPEEADIKNWRIGQARLRKLAQSALESLGYYEAEFAFQREGQTVTLRVTPGEPVRVRSIQLKFLGEAGNDVAFTALRESLPLSEGDIFHHGKYESFKARIQNLALERGYFDGEWQSSEVAVDLVQHSAVIELAYDSGQRYQFGEVSFQNKQEGGQGDINESVLHSLVPFKNGEPYEAAKVIKLNNVLLDSRYFADVRVRVETDQAVERTVPVVVSFSTHKPNSVDVGLGYSTDVGGRISLAWRRPLFNKYGHGVEANTELAEVRRSFSTKYTIPINHPINDTLQLLYGVQREEIDTTVNYNTVLGVQRQTNRDSGWQRIQSLRFSRDTDEYADGTDLKTDLLLPGFSLNRVRSRGGLDPSWGDRQFYQIEAASTQLLSDADLVVLRAGFRLLRTLADKHQFQLRLDGGTIFTDDFAKVPTSLRFFAGGDQSVRGYDYKSLAPRDDKGEVAGGRHLATGTVEYGYLFRPRWRGALFVDAGNAFDSVTEPVKVGTGFGLRWISPVGAIRLDFAWGVSEDNVPFRVHFSLGPSL